MESVISEDDIARAADTQTAIETAPQQAPEMQGQATPDPAAALAGSESQPADPWQRERAGYLSDLKEERQKRQRYESDLAARDRELAQMHGRQEMLERLYGQAQQTPRAPTPPPPTPVFWDSPEDAVRAEAAAAARQQFDPVSRYVQSVEQRMMLNARDAAEDRYGADAVKAAEEWFNTEAARGAIDPNEHRRINSSPNPFRAAVEAHRRVQTLSKVGDDPDKWFQSQLDQRLGSDPEFQKTVLSRLQGHAQSAQAAGQSAPVFIPPSVNAMAGSPARGETSISEDDIYAAAPARMGRR